MTFPMVPTRVKVAIIPAVVALFILVRLLFYYRGIYIPPKVTPPGPEVAMPTVVVQGVSQEIGKGEGHLVIDFAHDNNFGVHEIGMLLSRIIAKGASYEFSQKDDNLEEKLRYADSLAVILPQKAFSPSEKDMIERFVQKGGKLMLINEPTRVCDCPSLAGRFGVIFDEPGYLYDLHENAGNFTYIFLTEFVPNELTKNIHKLVFYNAGSISSPPDKGVAFASKGTLSSVPKSREKYTPVVLSGDSKVLALHDFTFLTEPYNTSFDNAQFISNIADFLTKRERRFTLSDFPYFFAPTLDVVNMDTATLDSGVRLKILLTGKKRQVELRDEERKGKDTIFVGFFDESRKVADYLRNGGISIDGKLKIRDVGEFDTDGAALLHLVYDGSRRVLIVLSDTKRNLQEAISLLENAEIKEFLIKDDTAFFQTREALGRPKVTPTPRATPTPEASPTVTPTTTPRPGATPSAIP
ncbi:MAG: hypothetical protein HYX88_03960 [Chloroflexi bacterium]|nr:hypothetical protein [Chloroflexota bacterium]